MTKTGYYLVDHPNPNKPQFLNYRRADPTGAIVLHTPEGGVDLKPPDSKALDVLKFIAGRTEYGSYHGGSDSDSIELGAPWGYEVWGASPRSPIGDRDDDGEALRANSIAIHLFIACNHDQWDTLPIVWVEEAIQRLAILSASANDWLQKEHGITVPPRVGTLDEFWAGKPGFYYHATIDDDRRDDPGDRFPEGLFLKEYATVTGQSVTGEVTYPGVWVAMVMQVQAVLRGWGYTGAIDGLWGPNTHSAWEKYREDRQRLVDELADAREAEQAAVSKAVELDQQLADAVQERASIHDRNVSLERFLGRQARGLAELRAQHIQHEQWLETMGGWVDEVVDGPEDG